MCPPGCGVIHDRSSSGLQFRPASQSGQLICSFANASDHADRPPSLTTDHRFDRVGLKVCLVLAILLNALKQSVCEDSLTTNFKFVNEVVAGSKFDTCAALILVCGVHRPDSAHQWRPPMVHE